MASNAITEYTSSSSHVIKTYDYDVFVSFCGDTRNNFTSFLFQALHRCGIDAFKDDRDIEKGEYLTPELMQAIEMSHLFVVVFSKNYASSTWCLRELTHMCNCIETSPRKLLPIFYDVDPSEVRKQSGCYGEAFVKHEKRFSEDEAKMKEVQRWRETLTQIGNISGWDIGNKKQDVVLDEIVQTLIEILGLILSSPNDHLVGMESRVRELIKLLRPESVSDVRVLGISGMDGIGKTSLARALYERNCHEYVSHCFIDDVSKIYHDSGILGLQKQLLSQSLNGKNLEICNVFKGGSLVRTRLGNAKRLIVFDNVDQVEQLKKISGNTKTSLRECLGGGSRIIIISKDEQILSTYGVDDVYQVKPLNEKNAVQLFNKIAFKGNVIMPDYEQLTYDVLSHLHGHPLAIEIIGNSLFGKNVSYWGGVLTTLRKNINKDIMVPLRIGFDELDAINKEMFLDIACFFTYKSEKYVKEILDFRGFNPEYGLQVLVDKSLLTIKRGTIFMHRLLENLGKYIVREKSPTMPRKWSRLWDYHDLQKVMSDNMPAKKLEAIVVHSCPTNFGETAMTVSALSEMRKLKLLILPYNIKYSGSLNDLSNELGYINWENFPFDCLPQSFQPQELIELILHKSNIKHLWEETKSLPKLRLMDLSHSKKLIKMQNIGKAINLEHLNLEGCIRLEQIDPSSGFPRNLTTLNLKDCTSLISIPHFSEVINLEILNLEGCTKLRQIDPSIGLLSKLTVLNLKDCKSLISLPNSILKLNSLQFLSLSGCSKLYNSQLLEEPRDAEPMKKLCICGHSQSMSSINSFSREQKDPVSWLLPSLPIFSCMRQLDLSFCNLLQLPDVIGNLHSLERLCLKGNNFAILPNLTKLSKLLHLNLQHCKRLANLPELPSQTDVTSPNYCPPKPIVESEDLQEFDQHGSGLNIFNCQNLLKENIAVTCFEWMMQIVKAHHQCNPSELSGWMWPPKFSSIIPGSEIPSWFNNQHEGEGNSIRIYISSMSSKSNFVGVACNAIFYVEHNDKRNKIEYKGYGNRIPLLFRGDLVTDKLDHMWLSYFTRSDFINLCRSPYSFDMKFELDIVGGEGYDVVVKKYGYHFVSEQDLHRGYVMERGEDFDEFL